MSRNIWDEAIQKTSDTEDDEYKKALADYAKAYNLSHHARRLGLDIRVDEKTTKQWRDLQKNYVLDQAAKPRNQWMSTFALLKRWNISSDDEFSKTVLGRVPIYLLNNGGQMEPIYEKWLEPFRAVLPWDPWKSGVNAWLTSPLVWWFKKDEVLFFEKINPGTVQVNSKDLTLMWLTADELKARWQIGPFKKNQYNLADIVNHKKLPAYCMGAAGITRANPVKEQASGLYDLNPGVALSDCMFRLRDVRQFEQTNCEFLNMEGKEVFILRIADYVRAWTRKHPEMLDRCIKERLYERAEIKDEFKKHFPGRNSDTFRKELVQVKPPLWPEGRKTGRNKTDFTCPYPDTAQHRCAIPFGKVEKDDGCPYQKRRGAHLR